MDFLSARKGPSQHEAARGLLRGRRRGAHPGDLLVAALVFSGVRPGVIATSIISRTRPAADFTVESGIVSRRRRRHARRHRHRQLVKTAELSRGGSAVAEMLGGRLIPSNTTDLDERKLRQRRRGNGPRLGRARAAGVRPGRGKRHQRVCRRPFHQRRRGVRHAWRHEAAHAR